MMVVATRLCACLAILAIVRSTQALDGATMFRPRSKVGRARHNRGNTATGRLRFVDEYLLLRERALLIAPGHSATRGVFVDVGVGEAPITTLETARALARHALVSSNATALPVIGVEIDPRRLAQARDWLAARAISTRVGGDDSGQDEDDMQDVLEIRGGSFALPLFEGEVARVCRLMNLFRSGYDEHEIPPALSAVAERLEPGGIVFEGSSSPSGDLGVAHVLRRVSPPPRAAAAAAEGALALAPPPLAREALLFSVGMAARHGERGARDGSSGAPPPASGGAVFHPHALKKYLPRDLKRHCREGDATHAFFARWAAARKRAIDAVGGADRARLPPADLFVLTARALAAAGEEGLDIDDALLTRGMLRWAPRGGVPHGGDAA